MKKKILVTLLSLYMLFTASAAAALTGTAVASVGGITYATLQEAVDAAARGETEAERVVTLLQDVDLGEEALVLAACEITLNLGGHTLSGSGEAVIVLKDGAQLTVEDAAAGRGRIHNAADGAGCAVLIEDAQSGLVVNAGTIDTLNESGDAVLCADGGIVVINGGSVDGIGGKAEGDEPTVQNGEGQALVRYDLTIGEPPRAGERAFGLSSQPGLSQEYGAAMSSEEGVVHVWLPAGQTWISAQAGCTLYTGEIHGTAPHAAVLRKTGSRHDFASRFTVDRPATCTAAGSMSRHCARCGARTDTTPIPALGHAFEEAYTMDVVPTCTEEGSISRHCSRCNARIDITAIQPYGHNFGYEFTVDIPPTCTSEGVESRHCMRTSCSGTTDAQAIPMSPHPFSEEWSSDEGGHWHACGVCGASDGYWAHEPEADDGDPTTPLRCKDCGYVLVAAEPA